MNHNQITIKIIIQNILTIYTSLNSFPGDLLIISKDKDKNYISIKNIIKKTDYYINSENSTASNKSNNFNYFKNCLIIYSPDTYSEFLNEEVKKKIKIKKIFNKFNLIALLLPKSIDLDKSEIDTFDMIIKPVNELKSSLILLFDKNKISSNDSSNDSKIEIK